MTHGTFQDWQDRSEIFSAIAEIMTEYTFDGEKGLCANLGKHENNPIQTIYFWNEALQTRGTEILRTTVIKATDVEREIFGAMPGCEYFGVEEDDNGFVWGHWINQARVDRMEEEEQQFYAEQESSED